MRTFLRAHWKVIVAIILLVVLALLTVNPSSAMSDRSLAARLRTHVATIATSAGSGHDPATPRQPKQAAAYIEATLKGEGFRIKRQTYEASGRKLRNIEVSIANVAPKAKPERMFIIGAHYDPAPGAAGANDRDDASVNGTAAVLELARLLKTMRPSQGTEVKFVFFVNEAASRFMGEDMGKDMGAMQHARKPHADRHDTEGALVLETIGWYSQARDSQQLPPGLEGRYPDSAHPNAGRPDAGSPDAGYPDAGRPNTGRSDAGRPDAGNFIAFVGTLASSRRVQAALSAFQRASDFPARGLAAPAYVQGVTLSGRASYERFGYPAIMITDTAFMRYPYYNMADTAAQDTPDKLDYEGVARVVDGLARTIKALAGAREG